MSGSGNAGDRRAFLAGREGDVDRRALDAAIAWVLAGDIVPPGAHLDGPREAALRTFPIGDDQRWVPIGPSVVRQGQAEGRPRVTGRIRDLQVDGTGTRAYAASAKGGVWYTGDGGATWAPVGGWAEPDRSRGGDVNAQTCGCLLVDFQASVSDDVVLVGTGETNPRGSATGGRHSGLGVLTGIGAGAVTVGGDPWEDHTGLAQLEGRGAFRLARHPAAVAGVSSGPTQDRVMAATSDGLFLGTRVPDTGPAPRQGRYDWTRVAGMDAFYPFVPPVWLTDVRWETRAGGTRLFVAIAWAGVAFSDDSGATWTFLTNHGTGNNIRGRMSIAKVPGQDRLYALGEVRTALGPPPADTPTLWQIPTAGVGTPVATPVPPPGVPADLWGTQRDYDQAIEVDVVGGVDRVFLGGSTVAPVGQWSGSLWAFDVQPGPPLQLISAVGVSRTAAAPGGEGADRAGLIGNNVHADIHAIRLVGAPGAAQVWVGCDGGVFVSGRAGRVNSFASRAIGLATLEVGFAASHPTSSHFMAIGCQDNGVQVRVGESVWELTMFGDGGGVGFHPHLSQYLVGQFTRGAWRGRPRRGWTDPMLRLQARDAGRAAIGRESEGPPPPPFAPLSAFYSGVATIARTPAVGRLAIGTNRVWLTDDIGSAANNSWRVIGFPGGPAHPVVAGPAFDPRPGGADPLAQQTFGVPPGNLGSVITLKWATPTTLLVLFDRGVVSYGQAGATWTPTVLVPGSPGAPNPANTTLTDVAPVPGTGDFYLSTTGEVVPPTPALPLNPRIDTCFYFDSASGAFVATGLRQRMDLPGPPPVNGPCDAAYTCTVDPAGGGTDVYVGTVTGVWRGVRPAVVGVHAWDPFVNGLPAATVQDLSVWTNPSGAAARPRLLRAGVQSRGMWEADLSGPEPPRTYLRVHEREDRRILPTPMRNPRRRPTAPLVSSVASPDIAVRPAWPVPAAPAWQLPGSTTLRAGNVLPYELWTFQTAFRWHFPSIPVDGRWSDQLGDLVELHRVDPAVGVRAGRFIDHALWDAVVGGTRLAADGTLSVDPVDPLAVFRPPWQLPTALAAVATEIDLIESVVPPRVQGGHWRVYAERCTVDVLLHHRDTRPLPSGDAFAALLWRDAKSASFLLGRDLSGLPAWAASQLTGPPQADPAGWNVARAAGQVLHRTTVPLDARIPRAIPIDVDLSGVVPGRRVLFVAVVGSTADPFGAPTTGAVDTISRLVRGWPHAAARLVRVGARPT